MIPVARPLLPDAGALSFYLKRIDASRIYSNFGPLARELEARLAAHFGLGAGCAVAAGNATVALAAALAVVKTRPAGLCLVPSWTFCASAHAILAAGLRPHFLDVEEESWRLSPAAAERAAGERENVAAMMPVAPFGAPVEPAPWDELAARTGIPVVIDAAAAFATQQIGASPVVISLHATKILGAGEGGVVLARDPALIAEVTRRLNFGFYGARSAAVAAFNGKMSEYAAAVGLAALDGWELTRSRWCELQARYEKALEAKGVGRRSPVRRGIASTLVYRFRAGAGDLAARLAAKGIGSLRWYSQGCHAEPAFLDFSRDPLPVTEALGGHCLGLPFYVDMDESSIDRVAEALAEALVD